MLTENKYNLNKALKTNVPKVENIKSNVEDSIRLAKITENIPGVSKILQEMLQLKDLEELDDQSDISDEGVTKHSKNLLFWYGKNIPLVNIESSDQNLMPIGDGSSYNFEGLHLE